jgi:DHA1 family bicyclomycin/chloramphenicol resistance-like MFS transporter
MRLSLLLVLGALSAFGPMAIDFYLPSFPALAQYFSTSVEQVQWSVAVYFLGLALGQLFYGPLVDRFGRRPALLVGVLLFSLASVGCALASSLPALIVARFIQALGGCAGMVASRAVVRDLCAPAQAAKVFSQLMLVMGLAPILAPLAGGWLLELYGWRSIFFVLSVFSIICWFAVWRLLPETLPAEAARPALNRVFHQYAALLLNRTFICYSLVAAFSMAGMFAYIAGSPFVLIELYKIPAQHYGWVFGSNALGFISLAQFNARWVHRYAPQRLMLIFVSLYLIAALLLLLSAYLQVQSLLWLLLPLFCCIASLGGIAPNATACAMAGQGAQAGSASALFGSVQFALAAAAAALVGALYDATAVPMALVIALCGSLALLFAWLATRT